jgi:SEC-C motif domain protein
MSTPDVAQSPRPCPCGSNKEYAQCCEVLHKGEPAANAEALMRSRYSAFYLDLLDYIERTWHASTRPKKIDVQEKESEKPRWIGLQVKRHQIVDDDRGIVEFVARYELNGRTYAIHEIGRFVRENGNWFYLDGKFPRRR